MAAPADWRFINAKLTKRLPFSGRLRQHGALYRPRSVTMVFSFDPPPNIAPPADDPLEAILSSFRRGSVLVDGAVAALAMIAALLPTIEAQEESAGGDFVRDLRAAVATATRDGDNLLVARSGGDGVSPFVIFGLARATTGTFAIQTIEIDRQSVALMNSANGAEARPVDRLISTLTMRKHAPTDGNADAVRSAARLVKQAAAFAASRLSIVKARLDLQATFLTAIRDADTASPLVRLDSHLNHAGAREMAMATRRLLGRQSLNIANSNRRTLEALLQPHLASIA